MGSPNFPSYIYIPLEYERRFNRSFDDGGWRGVRYEAFYSSILRPAFTYSVESFDGPGYIGYLFFMVYDMVLETRVYKVLTNRYGVGYDALSTVKRLRPRLVRGIRGNLTQLEISFMKRYGVDINGILRSMSIAMFNQPLDIQYLRQQFRMVVTSLLNESSWYRMGTEHFIKTLNRLMRLGITISMQHSIRSIEYMIFLSKVSRSVDEYQLYEDVAPLDLFMELANRMDMAYLVENDLFRYRMEVYTTRPVYRFEDRLLKGELGRCKYFMMARRVSESYRSIGLADMLRLNCKLCSYSIGSFLMRSKEVETEVSIKNGRCTISVSMPTGLGEGAYEAT